MEDRESSSPVGAGAVNRLVPFVHVADVEVSLGFYAKLGFVAERVLRDSAGRAFWARARSGTGEIMFARADGPVDAGQQAVLFYMYSNDVAGLRAHLLAGGVGEGAAGGAGEEARGVVFPVAHPHHMPAGKVRVMDLDGYVILIGQLR